MIKPKERFESAARTRGIVVLGLALLGAASLPAADVAIGQLQLSNANGYQLVTFYNFTGQGNGGCDGALYEVCNGVTIHSWTLTLTYTNTGASSPTNPPPASTVTFSSGSSDSIPPYTGSGSGYTGSLNATWEIPLTGVGGTEPACPPCDYQLAQIEFSGSIDPTNIPFNVGSPGNTSQFGANPHFDTVWTVQSSNSAQSGYVNYGGPLVFGGSYAVTATDQNAGATYAVGDVYPHTSDIAPNFGDGALNILDLIQELFAVDNVPGFTPAACSDRFDAMDAYPADAAGARGGDGSLDIRDLILELFRVNNLDLSRPVRVSLGGICAGATAGRSSVSPTELSRAARSPSRPPAGVDGTLALGAPEPSGTGEERMAVYLAAGRNLNRVALTFALGDQRSQFHFVAAPNLQPSLSEDSHVGVLAVAWLDGLNVGAGERLLLGYVTGPAGAVEKLSVYGVSASGLEDNREVSLSTSAATGR